MDLNRVVRMGFTVKVTSEQRLEELRRCLYKRFPGKRNSHCNGRRQEHVMSPLIGVLHEAAPLASNF